LSARREHRDGSTPSAKEQQMKARITFGALILALGLAAAWPAASAGRSSAIAVNSATFADPAGDSGNAPDVTSVQVANDDNGLISFKITVANRSALGEQDLLLLAMDTDGNLSDGLMGTGIDYAIGMSPAGALLFSTASGSPVAASAPSLSSSFSGGVATISINRADIGNPTQLNFVITASGDGGNTIGDYAPDDALWNYQVKIATASTTTTTPTTTPRVALRVDSLNVAKARAGKRFVVGLQVERTDTGAPLSGGQVHCAARIGTQPVGIAAKTGPTSGAVGCSWAIPKTAHGKTIRGSIGVTFDGASVNKPFAARIA
jgi:hypothetical protein